MTFNEFVTAAEELCPTRSRSLFASTEYCRYGSLPGPRLRFRIWDSHLHQQFETDTAEETLALYRAAVTGAPPVGETLETLGTPSLPE